MERRVAVGPGQVHSVCGLCRQPRGCELGLGRGQRRQTAPALTLPKGPRENRWGVHTKRKATCVATSGPSLGRKRPRRAAIAGGSATAHCIDKTIAIGGSIERR
jgi:hypothetical protein